jgi:hypothetical protein
MREVGEVGGVGGDVELEAGCEGGSLQWQGIIEEEEGVQASRLGGTKSVVASPGSVDPSPMELPPLSASFTPTVPHPAHHLYAPVTLSQSAVERENETTMRAILGFIPATKSF